MRFGRIAKLFDGARGWATAVARLLRGALPPRHTLAHQLEQPRRKRRGVVHGHHEDAVEADVGLREPFAESAA